MIAAILAVLALAAPATSLAAELRYAPLRVSAGTATFRVDSARSRAIASARIVAGARSLRVAPARVRTAATARRLLRVRVPRSWRRAGLARRGRTTLRVRTRSAAAAPPGTADVTAPADAAAAPPAGAGALAAATPPLPTPAAGTPAATALPAAGTPTAAAPSVADATVAASPSPAVDGPSGCSSAIGSFGPARPPACWRPYADSSPFNQPLPVDPRIDAASDRVVARLLGFGALQNLTAGDAGTTMDFARPTYFAGPDDPVFSVHCTEAWGTCAIEGHELRIPDAARAAGGRDGHMTVIDQAGGWEYDFWRVLSKPAGGGRIDVAWGGRTRVDGDGLGSAAVAANVGTAAGVVRAEEMRAGRIDHALVLYVRCDSGGFVYPAAKSASSCAGHGLPTADAPAIGTRFQLAMSAAQIDALAVPAYRKTLLRAMARYGMYVVDTGGSSWGIVTESALVTTSFGLPDAWVDFARSVGAPWYAPDQRYAINVRDGVDWARYLRVVDPCVARRSC